MSSKPDFINLIKNNMELLNEIQEKFPYLSKSTCLDITVLVIEHQKSALKDSYKSYQEIQSLTV
jgi:hypothetical protein